jgi:HK97 family phage prohead protease
MRTPLTVTPEGVFSGYASLFGRVDLGRDLVERGAFADSLAKRGAAGIRCLFQHDPKEVVGVWLDIAEDHRGLRVTGRLLPGVGRARELHALIAARALDGLSIGFRTAEATRDARSGVRRLKRVELWEVSLVTFPMLPEARLSAVRS